MFNMFNIFKKKKVAINAPIVEEKKKEKSLLWSNRNIIKKPSNEALIERSFEKAIQKKPSIDSVGMDSSCYSSTFSSGGSYGVNPLVFDWYASDSFIGFSTMAVIAQHPLISKACNITAKDALRKGWKVTSIDDDNIDSKVFDELKRLDTHKYKIKDKLKNQSQFTKIFGIRVALFVIKSTDPKYYEKPFNIDGITAGSYEGIKQIDPYSCTPLMTSSNVTDPASMEYYDPTYWLIGGKKYHKSHLVITRGEEVADNLKPTYQYAGKSLVQKIYNRIYSAESTANEVPLLVKSKRLNVFKMESMEDLMLDYAEFESKIHKWADMRDNFGIKFAGAKDSIEQLETNISDLDNNIMTQYQLVCSIANIPSYKLLNSPMKGFSSGDTEQSSYHEELENIQDDIMTPLLDRHYQILIRSDIKPLFGIEFNASIKWNELDAITEKERAEIDEIKSRTDINYTNSGIISQSSINKKLTDDENSPYFGMVVDDDYEDDIVNYLDDDINSKEINKEVDPNSSLNGAQVTAILEIVKKIATGEITKNTAIEVIQTSFPVGLERAKKIIQDVEYASVDITEAADGDYVLDKCIEDITENAEDAEYQGKQVTLNKPFRTPLESKKFAVYVKNKAGNVVVVRFGDSEMEIKRDNEKARASFRARHDCKNKTDKTKAGYWSCKLWSSKTVSGILS